MYKMTTYLKFPGELWTTSTLLGVAGAATWTTKD